MVGLGESYLAAFTLALGHGPVLAGLVATVVCLVRCRNGRALAVARPVVLMNPSPRSEQRSGTCRADYRSANTRSRVDGNLPKMTTALRDNTVAIATGTIPPS